MKNSDDIPAAPAETAQDPSSAHGAEIAPEAAAQAFAALGAEPRLEVIRALVRAGPAGLPVGALQAKLGIAASTLSHHLRFLAAAELLSQERQGRSLICRARFANISALADFLQRECCAEAEDPAACNRTGRMASDPEKSPRP